MVTRDIVLGRILFFVIKVGKQSKDREVRSTNDGAYLNRDGSSRS